jgi:hypothetical protein
MLLWCLSLQPPQTLTQAPLSHQHLETPDPPLGLASGYCCLLLRLLVLAADGYWMMMLLDVGYHSLLVVG